MVKKWGVLAALLLVVTGWYAWLATTKTTPFYLEEDHRFISMQIPEDNPLTISGVELGRQLFFDPILSRDSSISCATCHQPRLAFTDGKRIATGIDGRKGARSTMSLVNVGYYYKGLFWDGRSQSLEAQALHPVTNPVEMDADWSEVLHRLKHHKRYVRLFRKAFGLSKEQIDSIHVARALAQFQRTLISYNSKFDSVMREEAAFTTAEKRGWAIFFDADPNVPHAECGHCHVDPLFTNLGFENNGLDPVSKLEEYPDQGRFAHTGTHWDRGKMRVPTLRNIEWTAPYMHDGRFATLDEVLDHYISGGHRAANVSANVRKLTLSQQDKADLITFLKTLTDRQVLKHE